MLRIRLSVSKKWILPAIILCVSAYAQAQEITFQESRNHFPVSEKNLKKWGTPVFADLDQDGLLDVLLNDHGYGISVCWNENGRFLAPFDILMGDVHGLTTADFDRDGLVEVVMSLGGGSGSNARNSRIYRASKDRTFTLLPDFQEPLALMRGRTVKYFDADNDGDLDLINFAFPDKDKKGESENYIYENDGNGQLILNGVLPPSKANGQKTLITDFNNDRIPDLILYGHERVKAFQGKGDLSFTEVTDKILPADLLDVTSVVELDYDNDGDFDLFMSRGNEFKKGQTYYDSESKTWGFFNKRGDFDFEVEAGDVLNLKNYLTPWPNMKIYLGESGYEYEFPGETHSGKDIRFVNSDCLGFPTELPEKGIYIGFVGNKKWKLAGNTWAPTTGAVVGVENYPTQKYASAPNDILLENKKGKFRDVTKEMGMGYHEHSMSAAANDFNNDGWTDIVVHQRGNLITETSSFVLINQRGERFAKQPEDIFDAGEIASIGMSVEVVDYNADGKMDFMTCNDHGRWHLLQNTTEALGDFIVVEVGLSEKDISPMGAVVTMKSCDIKQTKRVGTTGSPYSRGLNNNIHFGLNACKEIIEITVVWSNGETLTKKVSNANQQILFGQ